MNTSSKLVLLIVTFFLLISATEVQCRRTYSSRSSSSGRGNRGKNQPSSGGLFSSWFGGSKSSSPSSGVVAKPAPTSSKKNWQTATSHATAQSKPSSNWANPYYKPTGGANVPSAPKEPAYGWKPVSASNPSGSIGPKGYPVQTPVQQGFKPASAPVVSQSVPHVNQHSPQTNLGAYGPLSGVPNTHATGYRSPGHQTAYGGHHLAPNFHSAQPSHAYQPSYHSSASYPHHQSGGYSGYHAPHSAYSPHSSFGGAAPSYQGNKLFGGGTAHYGYPGSGSWGIDTYGSRKSSGTGKLLTGLAVGAAGGYLTSSLVNSLSNPWKYSGYGYGTRFGYGSGYGSGYDYGRSRDESAFERGFERGVQSRQQNENSNNKETSAPPAPEDPSAKWIQCVAFDPQTQQTLINPNCSCTVTTSVDERTGQPLSVHHCTTLNGLVMRPIPTQPLSPPPSLPDGPSLGSFSDSRPPLASDPAGPSPVYGAAYQGEFRYDGGATVYLPPLSQPKPEGTAVDVKPEQSAKDTASETNTTETKTEQSTIGAGSESTTSERVFEGLTKEGAEDGVSSVSEKLSGGLQENRKRTSEFYGQLQKIVNMGNFVDGG